MKPIESDDQLKKKWRLTGKKWRLTEKKLRLTEKKIKTNRKKIKTNWYGPTSCIVSDESDTIPSLNS